MASQMKKFLYQIDTSKEIYNIDIQESETVGDVIERLNKIHKRTNLKYVMVDGSYIDFDDEVFDFLDDNTIFSIFGSCFEFELYSNLSIMSMIHEITFEIDCFQSPNQSIKDIALKKLFENSNINKEKYDIDFYWAGGVPFDKYSISQYFTNFKPTKNVLYVVLSPKIESIDKKSQIEILKGFNLDLSSLSNIACLLKYFELNGEKTTKFIYSLSTLTNFAPLILHIFNFINEKTSNTEFKQLISLLQTVFRGMHPESTPENIFQFIPQCCHFLCSTYTSNESIIIEFNNSFLYLPDFNGKRSIFRVWETPSHSTLFSGNTDFHVFSTNSIIMATPPQFAKNGLLFVKRNGLNNIFLNPITHETISQPFTNTFCRVKNAKVLKIPILPKFVNQLFIILVDKSAHVNEKNHFLSFIELERALLRFYTNHSFRYKASTLQGMMTYGVRSLVTAPFFTVNEEFGTQVDRSSAGGKSDIFSAISDAIDYINTFNGDEAGIIYADATLRILLITTGYNETGNILYEEIKEKLHQNEVVLDSFIMNKNAPDVKIINKLSHYTGGCSLLIENKEFGEKAIDQEAFLNITLRPTPMFGNDDNSEFDKSFPNKMIIDGNKKASLVSVDESFEKSSNQTPENESEAENENPLEGIKISLPNANMNTNRRILQEFRYTESIKNCNIRVYLDSQNISQWRIFMKAPVKANLNEKWFYLSIHFPTDYPRKPPLFKFISVPYHVNISREGRICLNYLDKEYNPSLCIFYLILCIRELLVSPNYDDPIDGEHGNLYKNDKVKFMEMVKLSANNGKDTFEEWLDELRL
ncbi:hypothetical protein TRFO_03552 [Tritrichomonas foetus]|uniref:UBC core domain-containing protein n=1 Tax=Tritrichomonas foetus TaxID=1144522 RepID=A0A1J4KN60_9EUKA|nr:hypothetical protein TRFO_03552 [Tritrichomonas foetus]|eukprot:OHT12554.1 hypothetical protein TRFO_03552 [Tritrichomonas foetus]